MKRHLHSSYMEIVPAPGVEERLGCLPAEACVAITCSPSRGVERTLELSERLAEGSWQLVPHIAARMVRDRAHLKDILGRLEAAHIRSVFVPGGDVAKPAGEFTSSLELLQAMAEIGHRLDDIGVAAYPEGHPLIGDQELLRLLLEKQRFATYLVTQMCFDARSIVRWLRGIRHAGVVLPAWIGLPGVADPARLLGLALRIGVGRSVEMLARRRGLALSLIGRRPYRPDALLRGLANAVHDPELNIAGFHLFSFNDVARTERWRCDTEFRWSERAGKEEWHAG